MRFTLDAGKRFTLESSSLGFDLVAGGKVVHYCRTPREALLYMLEEEMVSEKADGVGQVLAAFERIEERIESTAQVIDLVEASKALRPVVECARTAEGDRWQVVKAAAAAMAQCSIVELDARSDRELIATKTKAVLKAWDL